MTSITQSAMNFPAFNRDIKTGDARLDVVGSYNYNPQDPKLLTNLEEKLVADAIHKLVSDIVSQKIVFLPNSVKPFKSDEARAESGKKLFNNFNEIEKNKLKNDTNTEVNSSTSEFNINKLSSFSKNELVTLLVHIFSEIYANNKEFAAEMTQVQQSAAESQGKAMREEGKIQAQGAMVAGVTTMAFSAVGLRSGFKAGSSTKQAATAQNKASTLGVKNSERAKLQDKSILHNKKAEEHRAISMATNSVGGALGGIATGTAGANASIQRAEGQLAQNDSSIAAQLANDETTNANRSAEIMKKAMMDLLQIQATTNASISSSIRT